jgi:hypothetical protein
LEVTERIKVTGVRTLGAPQRPKAPPKLRRSKAQLELAERTRRTMRSEFKEALDMKAKLAVEGERGAKEKGREPTRQAEKLRSIVARLEGMSRLAIRLGILTPAENRALWAEAIHKGLYEGWR